MKSFSNIESGLSGERIAEDYLSAHGYRILERRFRNAMGEIDLIAKLHDEIFFVEVKSRSSGSHGDPIEQVPFYKQRKIIAAAKIWLMRHYKQWPPCHFSVIGVHSGKHPPQIDFLPDAFEAND